MTAKTAGSIQAAETIIHGRRRGNRIATQYRWSTHAAIPFTSTNKPLAYLFLYLGHKRHIKTQNGLEGKLMSLKTLVVAIVLFTLSVTFVAADEPDRSADAAAIRAHIESIFQAFIDGDQDKIFATHSEDWRGFLEGSRSPI